ncbi:gamma-glutamyltranspeptidase [Cryphonectria parasitica EP155]|uniref:Gamma-glutamyltranspeptidase n=1 Tax=Cryphonectria parasitica (strain ATCC 38755 / EP155) TaxID=660469 RepID=A0A9P5CSN4_CRYP1|nr:gamma-glutamyltranspeptidase [Cryphonectria parasitica EP155]KAF3769473.1 gamma-glutamyltranspeptidase [Cryphonectria parasitica EP155]
MSAQHHGKYPSGGAPFINFPSRRSVVHSTKGIVSTTSPLATEAGLQILRNGGNAADAAVAAAAVLNLVDPSMTGIGGDAFCLFYEAKTKKVHALNGSGRSPRAATLEGICKDLDISDRIYGSIPPTSIHSVTVPGAAAAWLDIIEKFGSEKVTASDALAPAIQLAEEGCPVSEISSYYWIKTEDELRQKYNGTELLKEDPEVPGGYRAPRAGEIIKNPLLAKTFRLLGEKGRTGFYEGPVAEAIIEISQKLGGYMTLDDLKAHRSEVVNPISIPLEFDKQGDSFHLWEHPPNGQGIVAQMALGILAQLENDEQIPVFTEDDHNSAKYLHALIQSLRIAFADGSWFVTDPAVSIDPETLLSRDYLAQRAKLFDPDRSTTISTPGDPLGVHKTSDTIYLCVTDADGNACSLVNSVADTFGSRIVPPGVGFVLQNRGAGFHLGPPNHPNLFAPGKRPYNTIIPAVTTNAADGTLHTVFGVMGGAMQPQGHVQVLLNMMRFGMNPQTALDAPRVCIGVSLPGKSTDPTKKVDESVYLEEGIGEDVARELERLGHEVKFVRGMDRALFGRGQIIRTHHDLVSGDRIYSAGSDLRGDGNAAPLL